jgi:hypothetical protein
MIELGALISTLSDFEEVVIRYKGENIFAGQVGDTPRKLPLNYWLYDIARIIPLDKKLLVEIEREQ